MEKEIWFLKLKFINEGWDAIAYGENKDKLPIYYLVFGGHQRGVIYFPSLLKFIHQGSITFTRMTKKTMKEIVKEYGEQIPYKPRRK